MPDFDELQLEEINAARSRLQSIAVRTPLLRLELEEAPAEIYLKLENLQPVGSFKVRGAGNAMRQLDAGQLAQGVWTASAGNMGLALAWLARRLGTRCTVLVPDDAPAIKTEAIKNLGAEMVRVPFDDYQQIQSTRRLPELPGIAGEPGCLVHPFADRAVIAGNATIGLEILEELPETAVILAPYGGGGLSCGIGLAINAAGAPVQVLACEVATAAPLAASLRAGRMVTVPYTASFVSGMGAPFVFDEMWPLASTLLKGALVIRLEAVADAIRLLAARQRIVAEGAGAVALAAALTCLPSEFHGRKVVCLVSGGNISQHHLVEVLSGNVPA